MPDSSKWATVHATRDQRGWYSADTAVAWYVTMYTVLTKQCWLFTFVLAYMYGEAPFRNPPNDLTHCLNWWKSLAKDSGACVLAVSHLLMFKLWTNKQWTSQIVAIKLFSVSPSKICNECTASKMSAFGTVKQNGLSGANIIQMAQLQQYWNHGFSNPNYTHKAKLTIPECQSQPTTIVLPPPSLQDLLNPAPTNKATNNISDMPTTSATTQELYGNMAFDDGDDNESPLITIVWGANLEHLAIEALVDLSNPKLWVRFQEPSAAASGSVNSDKASGTQPVKAALSKWSEEDLQWASKGDIDWWDSRPAIAGQNTKSRSYYLPVQHLLAS